jgi:hypothetical protein
MPWLMTMLSLNTGSAATSRVRARVNPFVDAENVRQLDGLRTPITSGSSIVPAVAGGSPRPPDRGFPGQVVPFGRSAALT